MPLKAVPAVFFPHVALTLAESMNFLYPCRWSNFGFDALTITASPPTGTILL
jgi:hypothetical protein